MSDKKEPISKARKYVTRALLITGMVFSILAFVLSLGLFAAYIGLYVVVLVLALIVLLAVVVIAGVLAFIVFMFAGFFVALAGGTSSNFAQDIFDQLFGQVLKPEYFEKFGIGSLFYAIGLPILSTLVCISFVAMIFAIVAFATFEGSKGKAGGIVGGIFAILSSLTGVFSLIEFAGGIMMFILNKDEYMIGHEEDGEEEPTPSPKAIVMKEVVDYTK